MTNKPEISHIQFENDVFPTKADIELWDSLTPEEQLAVTIRDVEEGADSGIAEPETADEKMNRVRAMKKEHAV